MRNILVCLTIFQTLSFGYTCNVVNKEINDDNNTYFIDYDKDWKIYGTFLFTKDLNCHIASSGREVCDNNIYKDQDLICLKNIILEDIKDILYKKIRLNKKHITYELIRYNYKNTPYEKLFKVLLMLDKVSRKLTPKTLIQYNNIAYYLQKAGANKEAIYLLEKIIKKFPKRTVAYINLGDAYWALGEIDRARKAYTTYIEQMCTKGLQKKIPKKVLERVKKRGGDILESSIKHITKS